MRLLIGPAGLPERLDTEALARAYAWRQGVRASMLTSLDGVVTGGDGRSGSLGTGADRTVYQLNRRLAEAIVVGAGTARAEGYGLPDHGQTLVVVSRSGTLPDRLVAEAPRAGGRLVLAVGGRADGAPAERMLGPERVWRLGEGAEVDQWALRQRLEATGRRRILHEGGPQLLSAALADGVVDELCLTMVPRLLGEGVRLLADPAGAVALTPVLLLESEGALIGRWRFGDHGSITDRPEGGGPV